MRCDYCKCFLEELDEEDIIGNTCRECYEHFELGLDEEEDSYIEYLSKFKDIR